MAASSWQSARVDSKSRPSSKKTRFTRTDSPTSGSSNSGPASARTTFRNGSSLILPEEAAGRIADTIRGFAASPLLIVDEAERIGQAIQIGQEVGVVEV